MICRGVGPEPERAPAKPACGKDIDMTIVYDNYADVSGLTTAWGFGCLIEGLEKTILFDTGGDGRILLANMKKLDIDPTTIDVVVLSHEHWDHVGGLQGLIQARVENGMDDARLPVYIPTGFPERLKKDLRSLSWELIEADEPAQVCAGARTTGTLGKGQIVEHGLVVKTPAGWVLVTGCAHPGVENLAAAATKMVGEPLELVLGGFHMLQHSPTATDTVIDRCEKLGALRIAPCHCTGDAARERFAARFGDRCILPGVGHHFAFERG
jgi:7,8-dihydropterin-6-yl-methyl-4-(beta-D-ribofuranosyl)aminobenzene 5'-phosphate synthase